jgi:hypothetical protein
MPVSRRSRAEHDKPIFRVQKFIAGSVFERTVVLSLANLAPTVWVSTLPIIEKNYLSVGPKTRRKRSVCSRVLKCTIERVPYLIFDKVMGI